MDGRHEDAHLTPHDIETIARRMRELIRDQLASPRYVDAATLARHLSVERDWIYAHARELCAIRLGGPHGRLRFDLARVTRLLAEDRREATSPPPRRRDCATRRGTNRCELLPYEPAP